MLRRIGRNLGLALALFAGVASVRGQEPALPMAPIQGQLPELPNTLPKVQRLPFDPAPTPPPAPAPTPQPQVEVPISPNTGLPQLNGDKRYSLADMAELGNNYIDARYVVNSQRPDDLGLWERTRDGYADTLHRLVRDYKRFYLSENLLYVGLAVGIVAPFANTDLDQRIRDGYQRQAAVGQNQTVDQMADGFKQFGEYKYVIPAYFAFSAVQYLFPECVPLQYTGQFGDRSLRALAVGAPMVGALQYGLGAGRPFGNDSRWHPGRASNSASGHAFVGSIPFLTAASMVENRVLKALLIAASFGTGWSRIHHDAHYTSQVILGWSIGFLAVEAVNFTEAESRFRFVPLEVPNGYGVGLEVQF